MTREATVTPEISKHERRRAAREARQAERAREMRSKRMQRWASRSGLEKGDSWIRHKA